jgi:hypothetical protein
MDSSFGLNMDFADIPAGGGDVLDNFDFDSFLHNEGIGFEFNPEAEDLLDADMHSISAQASHIPLDAVAGALGAEAFRRARSSSRSTKERSRSRSRCRKRRLSSRARYESTAGQLGSPATVAATVGGLAAKIQDYRGQAAETVVANDRAPSRSPARCYSKSANQHPRKRALSDAFSSYEDDYAAFAPPSMGSPASAAPVTRKAFMRVPENDDGGGMSLQNPTALQALLDHWLDAGAAAVLLESS